MTLSLLPRTLGLGAVRATGAVSGTPVVERVVVFASCAVVGSGHHISYKYLGAIVH